MATMVYLKGALEPLRFDEPFNVTWMNMSAAQNVGARFFVLKDIKGEPCAVALDQVLYLKETE